MVGIPGLYFVIAGDDRARFVRPDPKNSLHTIVVVDFTTLRKRDDDASAGPAFRTGSPDQHGLEQIRFVRLLAARIKEDFAADLFSHLVVVAPPHVLRDLMAVIDATIGASLFGSLAKDLVTVPDLELGPHLLPWLQPAQPAWAPMFL